MLLLRASTKRAISALRRSSKLEKQCYLPIRIRNRLGQGTRALDSLKREKRRRAIHLLIACHHVFPVICRFRLRGARDGDALRRGYDSALNQMPSNSAHMHISTIIRKQTQRERDDYRSTNDALRNTVLDIEPPTSSLCTVKWHYVEMPRLLKWSATRKANSASSLGYVKNTK